MNTQKSSFVEEYREKSVERLFQMKSFSSCWPVWLEEMGSFTDNFQSADKVYNLGSHLSEIFRSTSNGTRDQGDVSSGGAAWEGLVCWYLNLILSSTNGVAIKQNKALMPNSISQSMTVKYRNKPTNTEADLSVIILPDVSNNIMFSKSALDEFVKQNFHKIELHNIQCKTNWNDNAQIPMLWDMVYHFSGIKNNNITIGDGGFTLNDLKKFTYSFITVPTQKKPIKPNSMPVQRVESLTGGNYWGQPNLADVAASINEIFKRNFSSAFKSHIQAHIEKSIEKRAGLFKKLI